MFAEHGLYSRARDAVASVASAPSDGSVAPAYHSIPARTIQAQNARASDGPVSSLHRFCRVHCRFSLRVTTKICSPLVSVGVSLTSATSLKLCARRTLPCTHGNQPWSTSLRRRSEWFSQRRLRPYAARLIMTHYSARVSRTKMDERLCPGRNQFFNLSEFGSV